MRRVVVTGMGVISPVGNTVETFWERLVSGTPGIDFITRFDASDFAVKIAAEVKDFDPLCCMDKATARRTDLFTHYAMAAAAQAMVDCGLSDDGSAVREGVVDSERFGVYAGSGIGGMETFMAEHEKLLTGGPKKVSPYYIPMMISNIAAGNIAIRYGAQGPALPVVTACTTSTSAIGEAMRTIRHGYADIIIAGGSEATVNPLAVAGFANCMALTKRNVPSEASIPFDIRRDGFVMGEGAGMLVLEEYGHAVKRGARIYAEIAGYGATTDAYHITAPHPESVCAARAISLAVAEAGLAFDKNSAGEAGSLAAGHDVARSIYFNAHGTSTPPNDKAETLAIKLAFGELARKIAISSTKSVTGHMLGATGAAEAIASVLALTRGVIPPTAGYRDPDPDCDLDYVPNTARKQALSLAVSLSLGFGGHNACLAFTKCDEGV